MTTHPDETPYREVGIEKIHVPEGRRRLDESKVAALAESIAVLGLLQPVGLTSDHRLIYGLHRLEAHRRLGRGKIPSLFHSLDELHQRLAEIDENIQRSNLTVLDTCRALARRKDIYEALHPESQPVTKRGGPGRGKKTSDKMSPVSFGKDTAAKIGKHRRTVERMVKLGNELDDEAAKLLADTPFADKPGVLAKLARLPGDAQRHAAEKLAQGQARTLAAATGVTTSAPTVQDDAKRGLSGLKAVVAALKSCGVYAQHEGTMLAVKRVLEKHAHGLDAEDTSEADEEEFLCRG
jgi:ParB family chromosome partitioning protein